MATNSGGGLTNPGSQNGGGLPSEAVAVRIDRDVEPVWETEALPEWVVTWLIPMLSAGQKWPEASESGLSKLAQAYQALGSGAVSSAPEAGAATRVVAAGWAAPATADFVSRAQFLYGHDGGLAGVAQNAQAYTQQANDFAVETQYSKLSINVAFWVTVVAIAIALYAAFFTAGSSTAIIGPYAAAARAAISRILVRLAMVGGRQLAARQLARVTVLSGATGRGLITRLLASSMGRELIEEIGEEFFIDAAAQYQQMKMGTRQEWDWKKSQAAIIGAGGGAIIGTRVAGPVSRVTSRVPGFAGRALTTGLTNTIASPAGSFIANGLVYDQWGNPFTPDALLGGFFGGAGRTGTISPFNPDVYTALAHPITSLASAYDAAARADAARLGGAPPGDPAAGSPVNGGPNGSGPNGSGDPAAAAAVGRPGGADPAQVRSTVSTPGRAPANPVATNDLTGNDGARRTATGAPDADPSTQRRPARNASQPSIPDQQPQAPSAPDTDGSESRRTGQQGQPARQADHTAASQPDPDAQPDATPDQPDATPARPDATPAQPEATAPQPEAAPQPNPATAPQPDATAASQPDATSVPQPDATAASQPDATSAPQPEGPVRPEAGTTPQPNTAAAPQPDATSQPETAAAPQPDSAAAVQPAAAGATTRLTDDVGPADAPVASVTPAARARTALIGALTTDFPGAVIGPAGDLLVPTADGVRTIPAATMNRIRTALNTRAAQVGSLADLQAEASALLLISQAAADQETAPAPDPGPAPAPATSKPGTVTSRPTPGTRYVTDGRQGPDLTLDEVKNAVAELMARHFLTQGVLSLTWSQDGSTLVVETREHGTHHFRPVVGGLSPDLMGQTDLAQGENVAQGTDQNAPHVVHFNPRVANDQLSRVWLHEITDTLQATQEGPSRRRGRRKTEATEDMCVAAQLNELAFLSEKWHAAPTLQDKRLLAVDIDGLSRQLALRGQTLPPPPWAPTQATRTLQTPPLPGENPTIQQVRDTLQALEHAEQQLQLQIAAKKQSAEEARVQARKATRQARKALKQHDEARFERARKARQENRVHRATQARHTRIAEAYRAALEQATETRQAYERALKAMTYAAQGRPTPPGDVPVATVAGWQTARALTLHQNYLDAMAAALPDPDTLPGAMPTGRLAHLSALTASVNDLLARHGSTHRFSPDELEHALRPDFHQAASRDGVVLRVGQGAKAVEVRVRLSLSDLAEVLDPGVKASEMMVGLFFQASHMVSATEAGSLGMSRNFNTAVLAQLLPEGGWPRNWLELLKINVSMGSGRSTAATGGAGVFAQGGGVADNRSESLLFDAAARWTVDIQTSENSGWRDTTVVDSGAPGDSSAQRLWVSHSYTDAAPRKLEWIPDGQRDPRMPNHVLVSAMTGMDDALTQIMEAAGGEYAKVGSRAHGELRTFMTELSHRLRQAATPEGLERVFGVDGEPDLRVTAKTEVVLVAAKPVGGRTAEEWEEEVLVDFAAVPGGTSVGRSLDVNASVGPNLDAFQGVNGPGSYAPDIGPKVRGSRSGGRSYSATANKQAIYPSVHRKTSPKQAYRLETRTTFTVERVGRRPVKLPSVRSSVVVSMRESAAYRYGLPVDRAALVFKNGQPLIGADGRQVLQGDPRPDPPPGRRPALPDWLGDGPGQLRGAGPALVQDIDGLDTVRTKVMDELAKRGIIPKTVNGVPQYSSNRLERASQILNRQEVLEQLSEHRIRSAYDALAQAEQDGTGGLTFDLVLHGLNSAPEHYMVRLSLKQDFGDVDYVGYTDSETVVNLGIGSDTSGRGISKSRTYAGGGSVAVGDGPGEGQDGLAHEVGANAGGNRTRTVGSSAGSTVNVVTLQESTSPVAIFSLAHDLKVELVHDNKVETLATGRGRARLLFATDLLPPDTSAGAPAPLSAPLGPMRGRLLSRARLLHMDVRGLIPAAQRVLPEAMRGDSAAYQHIAAFLNVRNLVAHPKLLNRPLTTDLAIRPQGMPTRSALSLSAETGEAEVLAVVDQVNGNILFGLNSAGVSWGGSSGVNVGASVSGSDLDDGGTSSDGGSLGLPSRSGGTSESTSLLDIWGTEELTIEHGRQYILRAPVDLTLTGAESRMNLLPTDARQPLGTVRTADAQGTALFSLPEYDALLMYAEGDVALPGRLVGDAIERFLNGSLTLDETLAVPLVQRYLQDLNAARAAGTDVGYAARHTPEALLAKIREVTGLGPTATTAQRGGVDQQLDEALRDAATQIESSRDVVFASSYDRASGIGATESLELTDEQGNAVDPLDAVLGAVDAAYPGKTEASPTLREEVNVDFSRDAVLIHVTDMWSRTGYERTYHVQGDTQGSRAEEVTVRARLVYDDEGDSRRGRLLSHTSQAGTILQYYRYFDRTRSASYNGSYSAGVDFSGSDNGDGQGAGLSTDRNRSYSVSVNQQDVRLQRMSQFAGHYRVEQTPRLVIEVERRQVRKGRAAQTAAKITRRVRFAKATYSARLVRRIPTGMIVSAAQDPGPVAVTIDPRRAELHPGHFPQGLWDDPHKPTLLEVVTAQFTKMLGKAAVAERRNELVRRLSPSGLVTAFERMSGPEGHLERVSRLKFKDQGARVRIQARLSDLTVVAGPYEAEKGEVDRMADATNTTVSRGRVMPVGVGGNAGHAETGLDGGIRTSEQASESVSDHHGARRERSKFEKGRLYNVRFRVDYDLTFEYVARLRGQDERVVGDPVHLPGATGGWVEVTLLEHELAELRSRMENGVRLAPPPVAPDRTAVFVSTRNVHGLVQIVEAARLAARERGEAVRVAVRETDGVHRYLAFPDGSLHSLTPDGGFAQALATVPPAVLNAADRIGLNLREVFMTSGVPGTFTQQVVAELTARGTFVVDGKAAWPVQHVSGQAAVGGSVGQGISAGVSSPAIENTPLARSGRPDGDPDLTLDELRAQNVTAADLGGAVSRVTWNGDETVTMRFAAAPDQHVHVVVGEPGAGLNASTELHAGTPDDPHVLRVWPRVHPDVVSSVLVHDLSHIAQEVAATTAGAPQGVVRPSLSPGQAEGTDLCVIPRLDEHTHLSNKWRAAADPARRALLADAIDAVATDLERRGHTPPPPPWGTGPRVPVADRSQGRIARLLNAEITAGLDTSAAGLSRLAEIAGVAGLAPVPGRPGEFTVTAPGGTFTLALEPAPAGATEVRATEDQAGRLTLRVPPNPGHQATVSVAEHLATHATTTTNGTTAATLARIRGLAVAVNEGGHRGAAAALRAEAERAGLAPGQPGAAAALLALARTGELTSAHVAAIRNRPALPEAAAAQAFVRGAALMGARVHLYGPDLADLVLPGRPPIPVEIRPDNAGTPDPGVLTVRTDATRTVGANERAAAAAAAAAVARAQGRPEVDLAALAEVHEAVRQVRSATAAQRPARLGVLHDLLAASGPGVWRLIAEPFAAELGTLAEGPRPVDRPARYARARRLADTTGWNPPEPECTCPDGEPCRCGLRPGARQRPDRWQRPDEQQRIGA
ncbi:WXG100-like domain-containing protein [Nonomuraea wenchangensis]